MTITESIPESLNQAETPEHGDREVQPFVGREFAAEAKSDSQRFGNERVEHQAVCSHCGLDVPKGLIRIQDENQFCCNGCRTAYELITGCELGDYYRLADTKAAVPAHKENDFLEFDSEFFLSRHAKNFAGKPGAPALRQITFAIDGLHCSACIWLIEKLPQICKGVVESIVNWNSQSVTITIASETLPSQVARLLADLGYYPSVFERDVRTERTKLENRKSLFDLGFAGAAAGNNMLVALALYLGQYYGMTAATERLLVFYSGLISVLSVFGPGRKILSKAIWAVKTRTPHMDLPVALGISVGLISGWVNILLGSSAVFFDSISVLIFVLLLGRYIQQLQQRAAVEKLSLVNRLLPRFSLRREQGIESKVSVEEIVPGDLVIVNVGETIPVDGKLVGGGSTIDPSILTGESFPTTVGVHDKVYAGTVNLAERIEIEATETAHQSRIATIFQDVERSVRKKTRIVQFADRIGAWFVGVVLILSLGTFMIWLPDWMFAANAAVAVLIVACPCALALATPLAISVALSSALRRKILIKEGDAFERLSKLKTVWFDKTGTLTEGKLRVAEWVGDKSLRHAVMAIESRSGHPVAQAIVRTLRKNLGQADALMSDQITDVQHFSNGISAEINGQTCLIGSRALIEQKDRHVSDEFENQEQQFLKEGWSPVFVALGSQVVAIMSIGDQLRAEAISVIKAIRKQFRVGILSGDRRQIVERVARKLGIDPENCYAELTPQQKSEMVGSSSGSLMIGDGVNDSSALAAADVAIAINDKLDLNSRIASIVLRNNQLDRIPELIGAGRRVMKLIYRNIAVSLIYNLVAVGLAIAGFIHPVIAAIFMPISSLSILFFSLLASPFPNQSGNEGSQK